jgi:hypothetical protein
VSGWSLDEKRFREEVFRALDNRWDPRRNLFRCVQLPLDVSDAAVIAASLKGVRSFVNRNSKTGTNSGPARVLQGVLDDAEVILTNPASRARHRTQVLADRAELERTLRAELGGLPAVPPAAVIALAAARQKFFAREDIAIALAAIGCEVRDPVALPPYGRPPTNWRSVQHEVMFLGLPTLGEYLKKRFGVVTAVTPKQLLDYRTKLQSTASGDVLTAEMSIITNVKKWVDDGQLVDLLRADQLRELAAEASMGSDRLSAALKAPGMDRYLADLGLPRADELAYALLCAIRYPTEAATTWQTTYREARTNRDLRTARDVLVANRPALDKQLGKELEALTTEIAEIDAMLERAASLERSDVEAAAELYVRVGQHCRDPAAESALRRCRPAAPARASTSVGGDTVTVEWAPSTARVGDITYRVVRHVEDGGAGDGAVIGTELTGLTVVDSAAPAGIAITYAVWTLRNGEQSQAPCTTQDVAVLRSVQNLELLPGEDVVELRWDLPPGASGARVVRMVDGRPSGATRRIDGRGIRDTDVRTGVTYDYAVESEYRLVGGSVGYGPPVTGRVRPQEPAQPVRDLTPSIEEDAIVLAWTVPPRGEVEVRVLDSVPAARPGQTMTSSAAGRLGSRVRGIGATRAGQLRLALPADGQRHWFLPFTVADGVAVAGVAIEYDSRLPAILELRADQLGNQVQLRWRWPPRVSEVLILSRAGRPPTGPDDPEAVTKRLTHAMYQRSGATVAATGGEQWIGVCVAAFTDGVPVYGPMVTVSASVPPELAYEIQRVNGFRNRHLRRLVVTGGCIPGGVRVIARTRVPPLSPQDGVELARFPAPTSGTTLTGEFSLTERARPLFLRVFPAEGDGVVLVPTHPMQLRID